MFRTQMLALPRTLRTKAEVQARSERSEPEKSKRSLAPDGNRDALRAFDERTPLRAVARVSVRVALSPSHTHRFNRVCFVRAGRTKWNAAAVPIPYTMGEIGSSVLQLGRPVIKVDASLLHTSCPTSPHVKVSNISCPSQVWFSSHSIHLFAEHTSPPPHSYSPTLLPSRLEARHEVGIAHHHRGRRPILGGR